MNPDAEERLRRHVAAILARAGAPRQSRADLEEELSGHLFQRAREYIDRGLAEGDAAEQAISDFGGAGMLGAALGRTYHSQLWASTIGVLLPGIAPAEARPALIGWLRFVVGLTIVASGIWLLELPTMTPVRALGTTLALAVGLTGMALAFQALRRGQRWALPYAVGVAVLLVLGGIAEVVAPLQRGSIAIPLGAILGARVLLAVWRNWDKLQAFVAPSAHLSRGLGVLLAISLVAGGAVPRVLAAIPDPTQAAAEDLALKVSLTCDRGDVPQQDAPTSVDTQRATLIIDATWSHTDLLPRGLVGIFNRNGGDTSGFRVVEPTPGPWAWAGAPTMVDTTTGESAGYWGSTSPSIALLPSNVAGSDTVAIDPQSVSPNQTIRTTWLLIAVSGRWTAWPRVEVLYAHLDRFVVAGTVGCGEAVLGRPIPIPVEAPPTTDPFPF